MERPGAINDATMKFRQADRNVYALGQGIYQGLIFRHLANSLNFNGTEQMMNEHTYGRRVFVVGPGVDKFQTRARKKVVENGQVGEWASEIGERAQRLSTWLTRGMNV
ncbi:MAG: hypothetical protein Q8P25_00705 [Candidatus Curtissbacteria bacterium]|nr:hypothetical protein [Candidatus Curtissbacteria bacterium]MDZ4209686.1 hypothetical protein [Candidatus Curtissbacteria bacterium]